MKNAEDALEINGLPLSVYREEMRSQFWLGFFAGLLSAMGIAVVIATLITEHRGQP